MGNSSRYCYLKEFKQRFLSLKDGIEAHNAEVMLAVRISPQGDDPSPEDSPDVINEFFAEHGFEFVDLAPKEEISDETMEHYGEIWFIFLVPL